MIPPEAEKTHPWESVRSPRPARCGASCRAVKKGRLETARRRSLSAGRGGGGAGRL